MLTQTSNGTKATLLFSLIMTILNPVMTMDLFDIKYIDHGDARLISTSDTNYAMTGPKLLTKNWKTVSLNGDQVSIVTSSGDKLLTTKSGLERADMLFIEKCKEELLKSNSGYSHVSTTTGVTGEPVNGNIMMTSTRSGSSSASSYRSYSDGVTSSVSSGPESTYMNDGMMINLKDNDNFSVSKTNLPFNWMKVFFNGDLVTFVHKDRTVIMEPLMGMDSSLRDSAESLRSEVLEMQRSTGNHMANTMAASTDMISNIFGNIMGRFPKPPDYRSSVGDMFGNNFPFGHNNSPFSSRSGWPFGMDGVHAGAYPGFRR